jgi:quinol monooxygenase YgiN
MELAKQKKRSTMGEHDMNDEQIVLIARLQVKADKVEEAKAAAMAIVAASRAEAGNINYDIHQSIEDETVFMWQETWANKAAIDEHFATPFFQKFFGIVGEIAAEPPQINLTKMITDKV